MPMTTSMFEALRLKYNAQIAQASANINVYMINPAGIGEHPDLVEAVDSQIKLIAEASGIAQIVTTVTDYAGNYWSETSTINVVEVDDKPVLDEFPSVVPVEHGYAHYISFTLSDKDSLNQDLTVSTNRSWATVNMTTREILVDPPTPGFTSVLVTACDESSCVNRIIDLEVRALAELYIEDIRIEDEVRAGDIFEVKVFVRNSGQVSATMIGVRCSADSQSFGSGTIQLLEAGQFIATIEKRQGLKVAFPEEIAYSKNWITKKVLPFLLEPFINNNYGQ